MNARLSLSVVVVVVIVVFILLFICLFFLKVDLFFVVCWGRGWGRILYFCNDSVIS